MGSVSDANKPNIPDLDEHTEKIQLLLIEDDIFITEIYKSHLEYVGYRVDVTYDAEEGWEKLQEKEYDLLLLDIMLPRASGLDVLRKMNDRDMLRRTPVIVVSNYGGSKLISEIMDLGAIRYMVKADISLKELDDAVQEVLNRDKKKICSK